MFEDLWDEGEVASIEVPPGVTLRFEEAGTRRQAIELGGGDNCEKEACKGMKRVLLEQNILVGLRQMAEAGLCILLVVSRHR